MTNDKCSNVPTCHLSFGFGHLSLNSKLPQHQIAHVRVRHWRAVEHAGLRAEQHAALPVFAGRRAVRAFDQRRVERNALGREIEMQLDRVVARLVVDIDRAGELRRLGVVEPVVVRLPTVGRARSSTTSPARSCSRSYSLAVRRRPALRRCPLVPAKELDHRGRSSPRRGPSQTRARTGDRPTPRRSAVGEVDQLAAIRRSARSASPPRAARDWDRSRDRPA